MSAHTKRSPDFQDLIDKLCAVLRTDPRWKDSAISADLITVLETYTTDTACIVKAALDEPIFVLRAHDSTADQFVQAWAEKVRIYIANVGDFSVASREKLQAKHDDALVCAAEMREYKPRKRPD